MSPAQPQALPDYDPFTNTGEVPSPCINVCCMDDVSGLCKGCYRTIEEITRWSKAEDSYKRGVWVEILHRRAGNPNLP